MELSVTSNGKGSSITEIFSYDPWLSIFPLKIGEVFEMKKKTSRYLDGIQLGESTITTEKYIADSREDINIIAESFNCWKIGTYDGEDNNIQTLWYSGQITSKVRIIDKSGSLMEPRSFSVI